MVESATADKANPCRRRVEQLHLLHDGHEAYLIDKSSVSVWPVPATTAPVLSEVLSRARKLPSDAKAWGSLASLLEKMLGRPSAFPKAFRLLDSMEREETDVAPCATLLPKLAINVANDCNLACSYCYANEGLYSSGRGLLRPEDAVAFADRFTATYATIERVQFMGGEPSMNLPAIAAAVDCFERAAECGPLTRRPAYQVVTNAVRLSPKFLRFCSRYDIELTVSLDGPREVHDAARLRKDGSGSYTLVRRNITAAQEAGLRIGFEPTFSRAHLHAGISLITLCQWFYDEFGVRVLHAPPMSNNRYIDPAQDLGLSVEEKVEQFCSVSRWGIRNLIEDNNILLHDYTARILVSLSSQESNRTICPAGSSQLSVSMSGELSPCWMFTDVPRYSLGNIWNGGELLGTSARQRLSELDALDLLAHPACKACAIQPVCFGCKGADFHESGTLEGKPDCDYLRAMVATCISEVFSPARRTGTPTNDVGQLTFGERIWRSIRPKVEWPKADFHMRRAVFLPMPTFQPSD